MELGQKLRQARLAAGLSQRQLCGDTITRNMLSQIENGSARPSMDTLRILAGRLELPLSYFLEELESPNQQCMRSAREAYTKKDFSVALAALEGYQSPDAAHDWEQGLLKALCCMALAEEAIAQRRYPYALQLLNRAKESGETTPYYTAATERERLLLLSGLERVTLPVDDRELLLRAEQALQKKEYASAQNYLEAAGEQDSPRWNFLKGQLLLAQGCFREAKVCFLIAQPYAPKAATAFLEQCCRELKDYENAYLYACRLRELE